MHHHANLDEALTKALDAADFCRRDLLDANQHAGPVESLVVSNLVTKAAELGREIDQLRAAIRCGAKASLDSHPAQRPRV